MKRVTIARNSKYNPKIATRIAKAIAHGMDKTQSSKLVGISRETLDRWIKDIPELDKKIESESEKWVEKNLQGIERAGERTWLARAWLLERTRPDKYSPKLNQTIDSNQPVIINVDMQGTYKPPQSLPASTPAKTIEPS